MLSIQWWVKGGDGYDVILRYDILNMDLLHPSMIFFPFKNAQFSCLS